AGRAADRDRRDDVVDRHREGVRTVEEGTVLVDKVNGDAVVVRAVGVGVALGAVRAVGVARAVGPVDDVAGDGVAAGIGRGAEGEAVGRAFVDAGGAADRDRGRDVVDVHREGLAGVVGAVVDRDRDRVVARAVGVGVVLGGDRAGRVDVEAGGEGAVT